MEHSRVESSSCSGNEDRISNLPDALIHQILSFTDMKYVVRTCVLSRRWRYIWTSLPVLNFDSYLHEVKEDDLELESNQKKFVNFVNKVLSLRENSGIRKLYLDGWRDGRITVGEITVDDAYKWIATAVHHNVQELGIEICITEDFEIPACLCTSKSLTELKLDLGSDWAFEGKVILPSEMSLPRLKSLDLRLGGVPFHDEKLANKFLSSFPALESLVIEGCRFGHNMNHNISLANLKHFVWYDFIRRSGIYEKTDEVNISLYAPSLTSFILNGYLPTSFTLENLSSLVSAEMCIWIKEEDVVGEGVSAEIHAKKKDCYTQLMMRYLRGFHNVNVLELNGSFLQALGGSPDTLDSQRIELHHLKHLKLSAGLSRRGSLRTIFYMLKISPRIESLYLRLSEDSSGTLAICDEVKLNTEGTVGFALPCMLYHLKFVEISFFEGRRNELKFLFILLKHATVLEKVVLCSLTIRKRLKQKEKQMEKLCEMVQTLFPRASTNVMISYSVSVY